MNRLLKLGAIPAVVLVLVVGWLAVRDGDEDSPSTSDDTSQSPSSSPPSSDAPSETASGYQPPPPVTLTEVTDFGPNPGAMRLFEHTPEDLPDNPALVVVLHGCGSDSATMASLSGWGVLSDRYKFRILLPQSDDNGKCYGYEDLDALRGRGDAASVAQMVAWAKDTWSIDPDRVFVTGFSSGGMFTNVMLGTYPDLFAAGGSNSGIPYRCATTPVRLVACGLEGVDLSPAEWAKRARVANPGEWTWPRMVIVHGSEDPVSVPINETEQMEQWTTLNGVDQVPDASDCVNGYPHTVYADADGTSRVETYSIIGGYHGTFLNVVAPPGACTGPVSAEPPLDGPFCAAYRIGIFFGVVTSEDTSPSC